MPDRTRFHRGTKYVISLAHHAADAFPWMSDDELQDLADDITTNEQKTPISRLGDGRIVDGRNRELACRIAGVNPSYRTINLDEAAIVAFVISTNLKRRELSVSQRAAIAAELANLKQGRPQGIQGDGAKTGTGAGFSQAQAAEQMGASERSVRGAAKVKNNSPEVFERVRDGSLDVKTAVKVTELTAAAQAKVAEADDPKAEADKLVDRAEQKAKSKRKPKGGAKPEEQSCEEKSANPAEELIRRINKLCSAIDANKSSIEECKAAVKALSEEPFGQHIHAPSMLLILAGAHGYLDKVRKTLWQSRPTEQCNCVRGDKPPKPECKACYGSGLTTKSRVQKVSR